jgi:hypothetical protein
LTPDNALLLHITLVAEDHLLDVLKQFGTGFNWFPTH